VKRLARKSLYTQDQGLEVRVEQLERRIFGETAVTCFARNTSTQAVTSGGLTLSWTRFWTTNDAVFSTGPPIDTDTIGDTFIYVRRQGLLMVDVSLRWEAGTFWRRVAVNGPGDPDRITNIDSWATRISDANTSVDQDAADPKQDGVRAFEWFFIDANDSINLQANVTAGGATKNVLRAYLGLAFWPFTGSMDRLF
jgi:hypothetical protein